MDEFETCRKVVPHDEETSVKSKVVVKLSTVNLPAMYTCLDYNTDINLPPSNWLSNAENACGLQKAINQSSGFASFKMANMFADCLGEIDVVSDAENIKNLLKLPYSPKSMISMMIHRVENTLLIDEFDVQKYLLRKADKKWEWLRQFISDHVLSNLNEEDKNFCLKNKSRGTLQKKNLLSKFLYHSLLQSEKQSESSTKPSTSNKHYQPIPLIGPVLPEPNVDENVPDPHSSHVFNRNIVWTFEDIRMLIGTDMPIFGGGKRPCISLRLRDMSKPINVLTGIDYWLDNLMCNVPEVVMCYHLDGIVQKYELIKTEDLPYLEKSKFSPQLIRNVAQNILAFLKANATKAGHTYWLFKCKNDDVVKLYDLTTLCSSEDCAASKNQNQFTVPVGMLLYTVARNMKNTTQKISSTKAGSIRTLLTHCIKLLPKEKYPKIVSSSHFILSDLYIPAEFDPKSSNPEFDSPLHRRNEIPCFANCYRNQLNDNLNKSISIKSISDTLKEFKLKENWKNNTIPEPLQGQVYERCRRALDHVCEGLDCLKYFTSNELCENDSSDETVSTNQAVAVTNHYQHISAPYADQLNSQAVYFCNESKSTTDTAKDATESMFLSWSDHLRSLLLNKSLLCYMSLAEFHYTKKEFGKCLRYVYMAVKCSFAVVNNLTWSDTYSLLSRAGDCFFGIYKTFDAIKKFMQEFDNYDEIDRKIMHEINTNVKVTGVNIDLPTLNPNAEHVLLSSCLCYEIALKHHQGNCKSSLYQRLGNVQNELGIKYMNLAQNEYLNYVNSSTNDTTNEIDVKQVEPSYQILATLSYDYLRKGITTFQQINDTKNLSFLHCNMGRFFRFRAHVHFKGETMNSLHLQKTYYEKSFASYQYALTTLGSRKTNHELWDLISWEYSTATFTYAKQLQDYGELFDIKESEVADMLQTALKQCESNRCDSRQSMYAYRSGLVHHRIANLHHTCWQKLTDKSKRTKILQLSKLHYEKAIKIFQDLHEPLGYFESLLQRMGMEQAMSEESTGKTKFRHLETALKFCCDSKSVLNDIVQSTASNSSEELIKAINLFHDQLQIILKILTKITSVKQNQQKNYQEPIYKIMYMSTLQTNPTCELKDKARHILDVINKY